MITVDKLRKEFKKTVKEPGLKGSVKSLFRPKSEKVVAVPASSANRANRSITRPGMPWACFSPSTGRQASE